MASKRYREKFIFWLDLVKDEEFAIAEQIGELKTNRTFAKTIRDGIRLVCDLRKGRVDVLFELFPWVKAEFMAGVQPKESPGEIALREQLERMEKLLIGQGNTPLALPATAQQSGAPRPLRAAKLELPRFEDDEEDLTGLIQVKKDTRTDATANFLNSLAALTS